MIRRPNFIQQAHDFSLKPGPTVKFEIISFKLDKSSNVITTLSDKGHRLVITLEPVSVKLMEEKKSLQTSIAHFTVVCLVIWPWLKARLGLTLS